MRFKINTIISVLLFTCFFTSGIYSQNKQSVWKKISKKERLLSNVTNEKTAYYQLDIEEFKQKLKNAPKRSGNKKASDLIVVFPGKNKDINEYRVEKASIMAPELQEKYPELQSFVGYDINDSKSSIRFSVTPNGINAMLFNTQNGVQYINPSLKGKNIYELQNKSDLSNPKEKFECGFKQEDIQANKLNSKTTNNANDGLMRKFRLALATTIEYSAFHISAAETACGCTLTTVAEKKAAVMAELVIVMTRVNALYERDLSLTMELVSNNDDIIFLDSDDYSNNNGIAMLNQNQTVIDGAIGFPNYDIGHVFSTGGGGVAILNSPCGSDKAKGVTGLSSPVGDSFYLDYVAHEMGHQYGALHTFNGSTGSCGGNRHSAASYEPGSGSTIMGYAGICFPQNIQAVTDVYFHQKSLQMMWDNINSTTGSNCASTTATGNHTPTAEAGNSFTIPGQTPYILTGSSTDEDGTSTHTYTWEQYDLGPEGLPSETNATGPLVRSFEGTNNPTRSIPNLTDLNSNGGVSTDWEKLASVDRDINFQLTVRDNDTRGGQTATDNVTLTVDGDSGPFKVTSQSVAGIKWEDGTTETINWDVANTDIAPVNTDKVNILLSIDGGITYSMLVSNTDNDGTEDIVVPDTPAPYCRIKVEAVDNIYFAINTFDFAIDFAIETTCKTYSSAEGLNISIPDNTGEAISNTINITDSNEIDYLSVNVDISHTYINDLTIELYHPDGTVFSRVWNRDCDNEDNMNVTFKDGNPTLTCAQPTVGNYRPSSPLNVFSGLNTAGNWSLSIQDNEVSDIGVLNDWSLEICTSETTELNVKDEVFDSFKIFPNPSNGIVNISLLTDDNDQVSIHLFDMIGRLIKSKKYDVINQKFNKEFNYGSISAGIYLVKISQGDKIVSKRIAVN